LGLEVAREIAVVFYLAGLVFAEALRLPRRVVRARSRTAWRGPSAPTRVLELIVIVAVILGIWAFPFGYAFTSWLQPLDYSLPPWTVWVAACVFAVGLVMRWEAQRALGGQWSFTLETAEGHALVTGGIYAYIRHPIYASLILWAAAQPFLLQNAIAGWGGAAAVALIWLVRVPREERMMLEKFGEAYRQYMARTGRLIPKRRMKDQAA
jgi:protein-S-isoprenylcysteine O-methyltransferase Ste14